MQLWVFNSVNWFSTLTAETCQVKVAGLAENEHFSLVADYVKLECEYFVFILDHVSWRMVSPSRKIEMVLIGHNCDRGC